ncbi:hypothetical protein TNIN_27731 [Trichonephila inaurata madagascariensis]|uniref:Uncharacterized protein n=1 Tax=Trichonephila inaurata madagascariensis TaxID=2747483 RepID=A0A8X7CFV5_9ARAC|nr:hypothetical protein TNIN_27731 [Trichonephila inaurata madagascariensis]
MRRTMLPSPHIKRGTRKEPRRQNTGCDSHEVTPCLFPKVIANCAVSIVFLHKLLLGAVEMTFDSIGKIRVGPRLGVGQTSKNFVSLLLLTLATLVLRNNAKNLCDVIGCSKGLTDESRRQEEKALQWRAPCIQNCCGSGSYSKPCPKPKPPCPSPPGDDLGRYGCEKPKPPPCEPGRYGCEKPKPPPCEPGRYGCEKPKPPPCKPDIYVCQPGRGNQSCNNQACRQRERRFRVCKIQCGLATLQQGIQTGSCQCQKRRSLRIE